MGQVELSDIASGKLGLLTTGTGTGKFNLKLEAFAAEHDRIKWPGKGPVYVEGPNLVRPSSPSTLNGASLWFW